MVTTYAKVLQDDFNNDVTGIMKWLKVNISYRKKVGKIKINAGYSYVKRGIVLIIKH